MKALTPREAAEFIRNCLSMSPKKIPYLSGPPGIGKSDIVAQIANEFDLKLIDIRLSQMLPEDLTGLPQLDTKTGKATYTPFDTFPLVGDDLPVDANGDEMSGWLIFLDELSSSSEEVMAAIYSLLLGHSVGGKQVHPRAVLVAAGNRATDSAIARPLPDTLITRMLPIEMKVNSKDWAKWARSTGTPDVLVDFIEKQPDLLLGTVDPNKREELETYPTPRGWNNITGMIQLHEKTSKKKQLTKKDAAGIPVPGNGGTTIPPQIRSLMFASVGVPAATAFIEHYNETLTLPNPWEVAQNPASARVPGTGAGKAQVTSSLTDYYIAEGDQTRDAVLKYMNRVGGEYTSLFSKMIEEKLGTSESDKQLVEHINKRLGVTLIATPEVESDSDDLDF